MKDIKCTAVLLALGCVLGIGESWKTRSRSSSSNEKAGHVRVLLEDVKVRYKPKPIGVFFLSGCAICEHLHQDKNLCGQCSDASQLCNMWFIQ